MIRENKKDKPKQKLQELIFGIHPILELFKAKRRKIYTIYTTKQAPKSWDLISPYLTKDIQIQYVEREILTKIAGTTDHQGVVAWASPFIIRRKFFDPKKSPFLVMLDGIQDPRNLGAILRSSYCTGADGVIIGQKNSAPLNAVALKSSAGLAEHLEIYEVSSSLGAIHELRKEGYAIYFATLDGEAVFETKFDLPICLVIGNEAKGVSKHLVQFGREIKLPQRNADISYNASVAAGILLFLVATQTKKIV